VGQWRHAKGEGSEEELALPQLWRPGGVTAGNF